MIRSPDLVGVEVDRHCITLHGFWKMKSGFVNPYAANRLLHFDRCEISEIGRGFDRFTIGIKMPENGAESPTSDARFVGRILQGAS